MITRDSKTVSLRDAAKMALNAIDSFRDPVGGMPAKTGEFDYLSRAGNVLEAALALPDASEVACGCGDIYPADSFEAGIMAAKGKCSNCAAALPDEPVERQPLTRKQVQDIVIGVCDVIYPQDGASYSEADSVFYGAFAHAIEKAHNIKGAA